MFMFLSNIQSYLELINIFGIAKFIVFSEFFWCHLTANIFFFYRKNFQIKYHFLLRKHTRIVKTGELFQQEKLFTEKMKMKKKPYCKTITFLLRI